MPTCGDSGTDGPLPVRYPDTVTVRRRLRVRECLESEVPEVEPTEGQQFARQFRRETGLE